MNEFNVHEANTLSYFEKDKLIHFIKENYSKFFDVVIINGRGDLCNVQGKEFNLVERSFDLLENIVIRINASRRRLGGPLDTSHGLLKEEIDIIKRDLHGNSNKDYLIEGRNPLLMIYPLKLKNDDEIYNELQTNKQQIEKLYEDQFFPIEIGLGFPRNSQKQLIEQKVFYVNPSTKWQKIMDEKDNDEDE